MSGDNDDYSHSIDKLRKYLANDPVATVHDYNLDLTANHIYLVGEEIYANEDLTEPGVEYVMANRFIRNLNILMRKSHDPILIHMKTCGGLWEEGMAIYDAIAACPNPVTILSYTHARSMSSLILQAADKRVLMPHSTFMFHEGTMSMAGTVKQFRTEGRMLTKTGEVMLDIYVNAMKRKGKFAKKSREAIREWLVEQMNLHEEVYLSAEEAVAYGFADEVFGLDGKYDWAKLLEFPNAI